MDLGRYTDLFRSVLEGRKWIAALDVAAAATGLVEWLREHGADDTFVIAGTPGTGPQPDVPAERIAFINVTGAAGMMDGLRAFYDGLHEPLPQEAQQKLDAWDPQHEAQVYASFLDVDLPVGGRIQFGARPQRWLDLEDKTTVDGLWDEIGVERCSSAVVPLTEESLEQALGEHDAGAGVVVTGDNTSGWHGGGEYSRIVRQQPDVAPVVAELRASCRTARVMPFLAGIPCSIHGLVFPDHVATVYPVEMIVFEERASRRFRYAATSSIWRPRPDDVEAMRDIARRTGAHLRSTVDYRGALTIDGVMTRDGFRPTELNPRAGAGLGTIIAAPSPVALHTMLVAEVEADWRPKQLEAFWRDADRRAGGGHTVVANSVTATEDEPVTFENGTWRRATTEPNGTLTIGPAASGGLVRIRWEDGVVPRGASSAPVVAAAFQLADELWDTGIGHLIPAQDLRA